MIDILTPEVLQKLLSSFKNIQQKESMVPFTSRDYGASQKKLAHATSVVECIDLCLLLIEMNETSELKAEYEKLTELLIQEQTGNSIVIEIRAGAGGDESSIFTADMANMYIGYANTCGWSANIVDYTHNEIKGYKNCTIKIKGEGVYNKLFLESGTHRVQRVPATETKGRIHTSTVSVYVYKEDNTFKREPLNPQDLEITTCRASGAGGQHVNTTDSAIRILHIPTGLVAECQNERSQHSNKAAALEVLTERVYMAQRRKEQQMRNDDRSNNIGSMDRAEKIRTYNYPRNHVVDHRYHVEGRNLVSFMEGNINDFLQKLLIQYTIELIKNISSI